MEIEEFVHFLKEEGVELERKIIGMEGSYFKGIYRGVRLTLIGFSTESGYPLGFKIKFFYSKPVRLGFLIRSYCSVFGPFTHKEIYKDMLANTIDSEIEGIECYAAEKEPIENLLREEPFIRSIRKLRSILDIPDYEPPISIPISFFLFWPPCL